MHQQHFLSIFFKGPVVDLCDPKKVSGCCLCWLTSHFNADLSCSDSRQNLSICLLHVTSPWQA